jgi:hypothetical protein
MSVPRPQTIQIFLPDGSPRGVRIAEITNRTVRAVEVPRGQIALAAGRDELHHVGLYFLFGDEGEDAKPRVYIGESEDCYNRLVQHHKSKDFWARAVVVTSRTQAFDKGKARWLEWYAIREAARVGRYKVENGVAPAEPYITEPVKADLLDTLDTVRVLVATLGFPLFEEVHRPERREVFYCRGRGVEGRGEYLEDGFLVLAGSEASKSETASSQGGWVSRVRERLLQAGILVDSGNRYTFAEDHLFGTPSAAAVAVLGRTTNGWTKWKDVEGRTLDALKRSVL